MSKKCPPGVICVENVTIFSALLVLAICVYFYRHHLSPIINENVTVSETEIITQPAAQTRYVFNNPTRREDVLLNPYTAPLRDNRVVLTDSTDPRGVPINVPTQSVDTEYRQIGILTRKDGPEMILPLMGRPLFTNRDKWQFYTMSDRNPTIKLPLSNAGKSCTNEYGCDNLDNGDTVYVEGYNGTFNVTSYDNNVMRYIPFI